MFSSSEPVAARSDCHRLGNALCLSRCSPVRPAAEPESGWRLILPSKPSITFWNSETFDYLLEQPLERTLCRLTKGLLPPKSQDELCGVDANFEPSEEMPRAGIDLNGTERQ